jgi:methionyl-tRNA formyltransferase
MIVFTGCKDTTLECITALIEKGYKIDLLITIDADTARKNNVAGYLDLSDFAHKNNIKLHVADSYSLKSDKDQSALSEKAIDIMLVIGWQRLIPQWLLEKIKTGAFGMHGSSRALPYGRGRSPMNWSLIQNKKFFITNLFKYNPGVDDGDILDTITFDLNEYDTARTCHYKNTLSMIRLLMKNLPQMLQGDIILRPQMDTAPTFYSKRTAEDGIIFWDRDTIEIYNLIRAVTKPFPGAFTFSEDYKIIIWKAQPFDTRLFDADIPSGTILKVFINGDFIVKTGSDSLLITEYETSEDFGIMENDILHSADYIYHSPYQQPKTV